MEKNEKRRLAFVKMPSPSWSSHLLWQIDKRLFRWDHLPSLAKLKVIQRSYLLLFVLPAIDKLFSPIIRGPNLIRVNLKSTWVEFVPENAVLAIDLGLPFSWKLVYFLVAFTASGALIFELLCPAIARGTLDRDSTRQLVLQQLRDVCVRLWPGKRQNKLLFDVANEYTSNFSELQELDSERKDLKPLPGAETMTVRLTRENIYFLAEKMNFDPEKLPAALENVRWYSNETRPIARWTSGLLFIAAIAIFAWLVLQGLLQIVS